MAKQGDWERLSNRVTSFSQIFVLTQRTFPLGATASFSPSYLPRRFQIRCFSEQFKNQQETLEEIALRVLDPKEDPRDCGKGPKLLLSLAIKFIIFNHMYG